MFWQRNSNQSIDLIYLNGTKTLHSASYLIMRIVISFFVPSGILNSENYVPVMLGKPSNTIFIVDSVTREIALSKMASLHLA